MPRKSRLRSVNVGKENVTLLFQRRSVFRIQHGHRRVVFLFLTKCNFDGEAGQSSNMAAAASRVVFSVLTELFPRPSVVRIQHGGCVSEQRYLNVHKRFTFVFKRRKPDPKWWMQELGKPQSFVSDKIN